MTAITNNYDVGFASSAPRSSLKDASRRPGGANDLGLGLQLTRASTIALTRLQIAVCKGERRQALEAIDRLHVIDGQFERLVQSLDVAPDDESDWRALSTHLADQKLALAFDKLVLASGISGPDLTGSNDCGEDRIPNRPEPVPAAAADDEAPPIDWLAFPVSQPTPWNPFTHKAVAIVLALMVTAIMAAAVVTITGF